MCTGYMLGPHVVNTVFQIFDSDGDGNLSHQEFINIMKDRLHRGARVSLVQKSLLQYEQNRYPEGSYSQTYRGKNKMKLIMFWFFLVVVVGGGGVGENGWKQLYVKFTF